MIEIDGSQFSGSGTIVRQAVAFSALTGEPVRIFNARAKRTKPGLRRQHTRVVEAICELVDGTAEGVYEGSQEIRFQPRTSKGKPEYIWDIGSAGSTTMLTLAVLPVLAFKSKATTIEIRGGLFQDFAPSLFHLQHVIQPLLLKMGLRVRIEMGRPGYVPTGKGQLFVTGGAVHQTLNPLVLENRGSVQRIWGIALASHLKERQVSQRMAESAKKHLANAGYEAEIETREDTRAAQPGAALAAFVDCDDGVRLGADRAGAPRRTSEAIGRYVARQLLLEFEAGGTLDRFAADQIIPFAALANGESRFVIPMVTDHVQTSAWLAELFLGATVKVENQKVIVKGIGFFS